MRRYRLLLLAVAFVLIGCSDGDDDSAASPQDGNARSVGDGGPALPAFDAETDGAPSLLVRSGETETVVAPFAYCWSTSGSSSGICADGAPVEPLPTVDGGTTLEIFFVDPDFTFESRFLNPDLTSRAPGPTLIKSGDHWELEPPDDLPVVVELFGVNSGNDLIAAFTILP